MAKKSSISKMINRDKVFATPQAAMASMLKAVKSKPAPKAKPKARK